MIRPFQRSDRDQLTGLVNAHIAAVVPGVSVSVNALMSQLEREPGEAIVNPWVVERQTLVATERDAVVAGAHLLRHGDGKNVGESYRGLGAIRWLVCEHDATSAGAELLDGCLDVLRCWSSRRAGADGSLPAPFVYGVPGTWPHIRKLYTDAGFVQEGHTEIILVADVEDLPEAQPLGLELRRTLGGWTRLSALRDGEPIGHIELETDFTAGGTLSRFAGWADIGNLVAPDDETRRWLLAQAADWLRLGGITRLVTYAWPEEEDKLAFATAHGFRELVRTERGFVRDL